MNRKVADLLERYPVLAPTAPALERWIELAVALYRRGGTMFVAGNGGSAADAEHICGELLKGFCSLRPLPDTDKQALIQVSPELGPDMAGKLQCGLRCVSLLSHPALTSAFGNDVDPGLTFAQQLWALARPGDLFAGISTGGGAANIRRALAAARARGVTTVLLTGNRHGCCEEFADVTVAVPERETYKIQELHLPVYHTFCLAVEAEFFPPAAGK